MYGLLRTVTRVMLGEDAGLSSGGVATNNVKDGQVAGVGVGPASEPGGVSALQRRRKRRLRYSPNDPRIGIKHARDAVERRRRNPRFLEAMARGGEIEAMDYPDDEPIQDEHEDANRKLLNESRDSKFWIDLGRRGLDEVVGTLDKLKAEETGANKNAEVRKLLRFKAAETKKVETDPVLRTEDRVRVSPTRVDYAIRLGLVEIGSTMTYYRKAIIDPERAVHDPK